MRRLLFLLLLAALLPGVRAGERPLFRDFVGLNGHTVQFKPDLYKPVCRRVRDYHPVEWDLGKETGVLPEWPFAKNRVSWEQVYGSWHRAGLKISTCLMFDEMPAKGWTDMAADCRRYGESYAAQFGPGGKHPFVDWVEIGNEPGLYSDEEYRTVFRAMAQGIRKGNPKLKIATCNVEAAKSDRYWKGLELFKDMPELFDAVQIHRYAIKEQWPVWRRTYPEDASVPWLKPVQELLDWRRDHAPQKEVWISEFGWDSSTQKPDPKGEWAKWVGSTDEEQAMWTVRSFFLFASMGADKAMVYFFNDEDKPQLHACSGLTRNFQPKPAYHAVAWMLRSLADYRFSRAVAASEHSGYVFEFTPEKAGQPVIHAAWHATENARISLGAGKRKVLRSELMPQTAAPAATGGEPDADGAVAIGPQPRLFWLD